VVFSERFRREANADRGLSEENATRSHPTRHAKKGRASVPERGREGIWYRGGAGSSLTNCSVQDYRPAISGVNRIDLNSFSLMAGKRHGRLATDGSRQRNLELPRPYLVVRSVARHLTGRNFNVDNSEWKQAKASHHAPLLARSRGNEIAPGQPAHGWRDRLLRRGCRGDSLMAADNIGDYSTSCCLAEEPDTNGR